VKTGDTLWLQTNIRSNVNQSRQDLQDRVRAVGDKYGCVYDETGIYPAWEYLPESKLRDTMVRVSRQIRGIDPAIKVTHAGLECGLFGEKLPGLDCVSAGTNMRYIHTADEKLEIEPFGRTLEFLKNVLKEL
jgi:dipeptidase D